MVRDFRPHAAAVVGRLKDFAPYVIGEVALKPSMGIREYNVSHGGILIVLESGEVSLGRPAEKH
jgi:hypothetical protein